MESVLNSTKKVLGISEVDTSFDVDVIMHINTVFDILHELGIGPSTEFYIEDATSEWSDFISENTSLNKVKSYVYLKVRMMFDPPATSYHINAMEKQILELEVRIRDQVEWNANPVDPRTNEQEVVSEY